MKPYFLFDQATGEYIGAYDAQESPLEPGEYIAPVNSTPKQPPATAANQVAVFSAAADIWSVEPDYRGQTFFDQTTGAEMVIDVIGAVPANLEVAPPASIVLQKSKEKKLEQIKGRRDLLSDQGGYKVAVAGVDKWFHSDQKSRSQQLGLILLGANIPAGLQWKTMDGTFVTMTQTLAAQILAAAAASDMAIFAVAETHKAAMEASADPAAYDYSTGWPVTFLG